MSQDSKHINHSRGWRLARQIILGALLVLVAFALLQVALDLPHENELGLRGGLKIESDPNVEIYIGDKHVGTGSVELTWDDLLGTSGIQALAVPINTVALSPSMEGLGGVTAKALTNDDSEIIWHQNGMKGSAQNLEPITFAWEQVLVRRQNGKLDLILVLDGEFQAQTNSWRRFLVPIRLRSPNAEASVFFSDPPSGGISSASGGVIPGSKIGSSLWLRILSKHESPPDEFSDEIAKNGLWTPGQQTEERKMPTMTTSLTAEEAGILAPLEGSLWRRRKADVYRIVFVREQVASDETRKDRTHEVQLVLEADDEAEGAEVPRKEAALLEEKFGMRIDR